jgi:hypothetical protein
LAAIGYLPVPTRRRSEACTEFDIRGTTRRRPRWSNRRPESAQYTRRGKRPSRLVFAGVFARHLQADAWLVAVGELNAGGFESALNCLDRSGFERLPGLQPCDRVRRDLRSRAEHRGSSRFWVWTDHTAPSCDRSSTNDAWTVLKTLPHCSEFYNAPNEIRGSNQTTNLGVRSSNLFGHAISGCTIWAERRRLGAAHRVPIFVAAYVRRCLTSVRYRLTLRCDPVVQRQGP